MFRDHCNTIHEGTVKTIDYDEMFDLLRDSKCVKKKNKDSALFTLAHGSQSALKMQSECKAFHTVALLKCEPLTMHLSHAKMSSTLSVYGLFHREDMIKICNEVPISSDLQFTTSLYYTLQFHKDVAQIKQTDPGVLINVVPFIKNAVDASFFLPYLSISLVDMFSNIIIKQQN